MALARINGYTLAVADEQARASREPIGDSERAYSGSLLSSMRASKRTFTLTTPPQTPLLAEAVEQLMLGVGHRWSFDESASNDWQWSSKGLGKATGSGATLVGGKFSRGVRIAAAGQVTWTTGLGATWTLMVWFYTAAAWHHYIVRSDAAKWVDGVRNDAASTPFLAQSATTTTLGDAGAAGNQDFDDLVAVPFLIHADMATVFGVATEAFSALPNLKLTGDIVSDTAAVEVARVGTVSAEFVQCAIGGAWVMARIVSFEVAEV